MNNLINCLLYEEELTTYLTDKIQNLYNKHNIVPTLATVLVGVNPASVIYVRNKTKKAKNVGINVINYQLNENVEEKELIALIDKLNNDKNINAILVQMPLPKHLNSQKIISHINPIKDVDGLHPLNAGLLLNKNYNGLIPCTPLGIWYILKKETIISGKNAVVVGRSNLVGMPIALILNNENATVTIAHSKTHNLQKVCNNADILVVAVGKSNLITGEYIKNNAIVIDVGINRVNIDKSYLCDNHNKDYIITGDVNTEQALAKNAKITPVPKGVGRLTVVFLLYNAYKATLKQHNLEDDSYDLFF
ncbi:UNVERIFIED_CONTAM: hypothetical protein PYX00_010826 [Menopon gallinae]|uniref:C-1-tetrahydrofolate synthase, cytoplasmic n=1 Tax=Menopon gallinae TaxID=328185 RepID=A0AAW2H708_9NEOP